MSHSRHSILRWFFPNAAVTFAFIAMLYCLFVQDGWTQLFRDSDAGWHIRNGERIVSSGALADGDPFSFSRAGAAWFSWEWAADAAMGLAHRAGGLAGVAVLYAMLIGIATYLWFQLQWHAGSDFLLALVAAIPMIAASSLHWLARPHVFGWVLLLLGVLLAERASTKRRGSGLALAALLSACWANVHGSFFLFPLVLSLYAAGEAAGLVLLGRGDAGRARMLASMAGVAGVAALANPYGWNLFAHVSRYLTDNELLDRVAEFQSFNFHAHGAWLVIVMLGLAAAGSVLLLRQGQFGRALVCAMFLVIGLRSARGLPVVALVVLPFACAAITRELREARGLAAPVGRGLRAALDYTTRLSAIDARLGGFALAPVFCALLAVTASAPGVQAKAGFPVKEFPVAAAVKIAELPADARILAPDKFGGYLIYRFNGERKVFFDGRSDFYGSAFMKDYVRLVEVRPDWRKQLDAHGFTHALLPNNYSLIPALTGLGWRQTYKDEVATLLAR